MSRLTGTFQLDQPLDTYATLSITMPLSDWQRLADVLAKSGDFPAENVRQMIVKLVRRASDQFVETVEA